MSEIMVVEVDGVRVEGEVERSFRSVYVRIVSPYTGLGTGLSVALFIPRPPAPDFSGPAGEGYARSLLRELYRVGKYVERHKESLRAKVAELDATIARIDHEQYPTEDDFRAFRRSLRAHLRAGTIDNRSYEQRLRAERKKVEAREAKIWRIEYRFFKTNFPMNVPQPDVLAILRSSE